VISVGIAGGGVFAAQALAAGAEHPRPGHYHASVIDPASVPSAAHAPQATAPAELPRTGPSGAFGVLGGSALLAAYGLSRPGRARRG
jgi:hypothetical protein